MKLKTDREDRQKFEDAVENYGDLDRSDSGKIHRASWIMRLYDALDMYLPEDDEITWEDVQKCITPQVLMELMKYNA